MVGSPLSIEVHRDQNDSYWHNPTYRIYGESVLADCDPKQARKETSFLPPVGGTPMPPPPGPPPGLNARPEDYGRGYDMGYGYSSTKKEDSSAEKKDAAAPKMMFMSKDAWEEHKKLEDKLEILRKEHKDELEALKATHKGDLRDSKKELKEMYQERLNSKDEQISSLCSLVKSQNETIDLYKRQIDNIIDDDDSDE